MSYQAMNYPYKPGKQAGFHELQPNKYYLIITGHHKGEMIKVCKKFTGQYSYDTSYFIVMKSELQSMHYKNRKISDNYLNMNTQHESIRFVKMEVINYDRYYR